MLFRPTWKTLKTCLRKSSSKKKKGIIYSKCVFLQLKNCFSIDFKVISTSDDFTLIFGVIYTAKFKALCRKIYLHAKGLLKC